MSHRRPLRIAIGIVVVVALALGIAQLVLPGIAEKVLRDRVAKYGEVESVSLEAVPAVELIWGKVDSARVVARSLRIAPDQVVKLLLQARPVTDLNVTARRLQLSDPGFGAGAIDLEDATLVKHGQTIEGSAILATASLQAALPRGVSAEVLPGGREGIRVRASGRLFGFRAYIEALVHASEGRLLLTPTSPLIAGIAKVTLFADPHLEVQSVSASPLGEAGQGRWRVEVRARLR